MAKFKVGDKVQMKSAKSAIALSTVWTVKNPDHGYFTDKPGVLLEDKWGQTTATTEDNLKAANACSFKSTNAVVQQALNAKAACNSGKEVEISLSYASRVQSDMRDLQRQMSGVRISSTNTLSCPDEDSAEEVVEYLTKYAKVPKSEVWVNSNSCKAANALACNAIKAANATIKIDVNGEPAWVRIKIPRGKFGDNFAWEPVFDKSKATRFGDMNEAKWYLEHRNGNVVGGIKTNSPSLKPVIENAEPVACNASAGDSVGKWLVKEFPNEKQFMKGFKMGVTFKQVLDGMKAGKDFYGLLNCGESTEREYVFDEMSRIFGLPYDAFYLLWLKGPKDPELVRKYGKKLGLTVAEKDWSIDFMNAAIDDSKKAKEIWKDHRSEILKGKYGSICKKHAKDLGLNSDATEANSVTSTNPIVANALKNGKTIACNAKFKVGDKVICKFKPFVGEPGKIVKVNETRGTYDVHPLYEPSTVMSNIPENEIAKNAVACNGNTWYRVKIGSKYIKNFDDTFKARETTDDANKAFEFASKIVADKVKSCNPGASIDQIVKNAAVAKNGVDPIDQLTGAELHLKMAISELAKCNDPDFRAFAKKIERKTKAVLDELTRELTYDAAH